MCAAAFVLEFHRNQIAPHSAPVEWPRARRWVVHHRLARRGRVTGNKCERVVQQVHERAKAGTRGAVRFPRALLQRKNDNGRSAAAAEDPDITPDVVATYCLPSSS